MPLQQILPTWLAINNCNFTSPSGMTDPITGQPYNAGGLGLGDYFDTTEQEANTASYQTNGTLHAGRYRLVQLDPNATAADVKSGTIGYMVYPAAGPFPTYNIVTSADKGLLGAHPVVFLNVITPGNYGFVQELGIATVLMGATLTNTTPGIGNYINATLTGVADIPTAQSAPTVSAVGQALAVPVANARTLMQLLATPWQG